MPPTNSAPAGSHGTDTAPTKPQLDAPLSKDEPTSGPAGSSYETYQAKQDGKPAPHLPTPATPPKQPVGQQSPPSPQHAPGSPDQRLQAILNSGFQARAASRPGRDAHDLKDTAQDLGSKALHGIKTMSTSQIALAVGVVAAGIAFFVTRGSKKRKHQQDSEYRPRPQRSPFANKQPRSRHGDDEGFGPLNRQPWGPNRYGTSPSQGGRPRVQGGSGYGPQGPRRDQGPASGRRYNSRPAGRQNPNSRDGLNSAF